MFEGQPFFLNKMKEALTNKHIINYKEPPNNSVAVKKIAFVFKVVLIFIAKMLFCYVMWHVVCVMLIIPQISREDMC